MPNKLTLLTDEEMVKAIWEAGQKYEANGGNLEDVTQLMRFQWIAQAQRDFCEKQYPEKLREIKKELEKDSTVSKYPLGDYRRLSLVKESDWQSFWKGLGI